MNELTREEHTEFAARMLAEHNRLNDENKRQNRRIDGIEKQFSQLNTLTIAVEKLADNMSNMLRELERQGGRLDILESRDGEAWRQIKYYFLTAMAGAVAGFILKGIQGG